MIFVSHAWIGDKPDKRVPEFVDFLRINGYDAQCDLLYQQENPSIHFAEMMAKALQEAEMVIIVLSENYKRKADGFSGGVGEEYRYIINDFSSNTNKYILVSFQGRDEKIIPDFLRGRDVVDLSKDCQDEYRELFSKLGKTPKYPFSSVSIDKRVPAMKKIEDFNPLSSSELPLSSRLNINVSQSTPATDLDKKRFVDRAFDDIVCSLKELSREYCHVNPACNIEFQKTDEVTVMFVLYKNNNILHRFQIWKGSLLSSSQCNIIISNNVGSRNCFNELITCEEKDGELLLNFTIGQLYCHSDGSINDTIKCLWEHNFETCYKRV